MKAPQRTNRWRVEHHPRRGWIVRTPEGHIVHHHPTHHAAIHWAQRRAYRATLPPIVGAVLRLIDPHHDPLGTQEDYTLAN